MPPLPIASKVLLCLIVIPCGVWDYRFCKVPNWLTLPGICLGIGLNVFQTGTRGFWNSIEGLGLAAAIYGLFYALRAMGAGDVKLMTAIGAVTGPGHWLRVFLVTALCGGVVALVAILVRGRVRHTLSNMGVILGSLSHGRAPYRASPELDVQSDSGQRIPHAAILAIATLLYLFLVGLWGQLVINP